MHFKHFHYHELDFLPGAVQALLDGDHGLKDFVSGYPNHDALAEMAANRPFTNEQRELLVDCLLEQYGEAASALAKQQINSLLNDRTFTVVTGHQLNIFTGPAFFIYKLLHAIRMAEALNERLPSVHVVPVYWMATEDHDLAEIDHFHAFQETFNWGRSQKGAVGRMTTDGLSTVLEAWKEVMKWQDDNETFLLFKKYVAAKDLASATRILVDALLGKYGLIIIDGDDKRLKRSFTPIMKMEIEEGIGEKEVTAQTERLKAIGFDGQVTARDINLFYLTQNSRDRITRSEDGFATAEGDRKWTAAEIIQELDEHPEHFSPNVILRPVYQEAILPNLCYIGGPGELSYWLQLKSLFNSLSISFPVIYPRNGAVTLNKGLSKKLAKLELPMEALLEARIEDLTARWINSNVEEDLELNRSKEELEKTYALIIDQASKIDPTLKGKAEASFQRQLKEIEGLEKAMQRAWKQGQEISIDQLNKLHEAVFPNGVFQERYMNFFALDQMMGGGLLEGLHQTMDPFRPSLIFVTSA